MKNLEEFWKPVYGFEKRFEISNHGRLRSINGRHKGVKVLSPAVDSQGYRQAQLRDRKLNRRVRIHTLVAENFLVKPIGNWIVVNHKDGNKLNNNLDNLEWCESLHNSQHAVSTGLFDLKGSKHPNAKLTENQVLEIRALYPSKDYREIGKMYNMSHRQIGDIVRRVNWKHV